MIEITFAEYTRRVNKFRRQTIARTGHWRYPDPRYEWGR